MEKRNHRANYTRSHQPIHGFTLVELLVVISIIALLMGILMPALNRARASAEKIICSSRLSDVAKMYQVYLADNEYSMVPGFPYPDGRWYYRLGVNYYGTNKGTQGTVSSRYDLKVFMCPVEEKYSRKNNDSGVSGGAASVWGYNPFFACPTSPSVRPSPGEKVLPNPSYRKYCWTKMDQINDPATLPLLWDRSSEDSELCGNMHFEGYPHPKTYEQGWGHGAISGGGRSSKKFLHWAGPAANHPRAINYLFGDSHVGSNGLWPYLENTPKTADEYFRLFHPKRNLSILPGMPTDRL